MGTTKPETVIKEPKPSALRGAASALLAKSNKGGTTKHKAIEKTVVAVKIKGKVSGKNGSREVPDGLPKKYFAKSTYNTHDIMHSPVEKTLKILDMILTGQRLFTM